MWGYATFLFGGCQELASPLCRCYVTTRLAGIDEVSKYNQLPEEEQQRYHFTDEVKEMPKAYNDWMEKNAERIAEAQSVPYFIRDNYVDGDVAKGMK